MALKPGHAFQSSNNLFGLPKALMSEAEYNNEISALYRDDIYELEVKRQLKLILS